MSWEVEYYQKENGDIPVLDFLDKTPQREIDRAKQYKDDYEMRCE